MKQTETSSADCENGNDLLHESDVRLECTISRRKRQMLEEIFREYNLDLSKGLTIGVHVLAAALPVLARGGELVFREADGSERRYVFAFPQS